MDKDQLKKRVCEAIRKNFAETQALGHSIFAEPELGFKEVKTSAKVKAAFDALGIAHEDGWGHTGVKARLKGANSTPSSAGSTRRAIRSRAPRTAAATTCRSRTCSPLHAR